MKIITFWRILIKIIGLWLLFECLSLLPQFFSAFTFTNGTLDTEFIFAVWAMLIGVAIIYILLVRLFIFKSDWLIEKLKLTDNFNEESIDVNIKSTTVLSIAIIVMGGIILASSIPAFLSLLFEYYQRRTTFMEYKETSWLIFHFIKIIIGYLLLTNSKIITQYIEKRSS